MLACAVTRLRPAALDLKAWFPVIRVDVISRRVVRPAALDLKAWFPVFRVDVISRRVVRPAALDLKAWFPTSLDLHSDEQF